MVSRRRRAARRRTAQPDPERTETFIEPAASGDNWRSYAATRSIEELNHLIDVAQKALQSTAPRQPEIPERLGALGLLLHERFERTKNISDIDQGIDLFQEIIAEFPKADPSRPSYLGNLGLLMHTKHLHNEERPFLEEAIRYTREAAEADSDTKGLWLNNLGNQLRQKYSLYGEPEVLDSAIAVGRQNVERTPESDPNQAPYMANLASSLSVRYSRFGQIIDLEEAVVLTKKTVEGTPKDHRLRPEWVHNLSLELGNKYVATGAMEHLDEAIGYAREAVMTPARDGQNRGRWLNMLSMQLGRRFLRAGAMADIQEAIDVADEAVNCTPVKHSDHALYQTNLGNQLQSRYGRTKSPSDLDGAIMAARLALEVTPERHPNRCTLLHNLSTRLGDRYSKEGGKEKDIGEAVTLAQRAVRRAPEGHPELPKWLANLGCQLSSKASQYIDATGVRLKSRSGGQFDNLNQATSGYLGKKAIAVQDKAISVTRRAIKATLQDDPERSKMMIHMGDRLLERHSWEGGPEYLDKAAHYYASAMRLESSPIRVRLAAAGRLFSVEGFLDDPQRAFRAAETAVALIPQLAPNFLPPLDKQEVLGQAVGLASDAAAIALLAGKDPACAIEMLETGRSVLAGSLQDLRSSLAFLEQEHPDLAQSYLDLRDRLDRSVLKQSLDSEAIEPIVDVQNDTDMRYQAQKRMDALLKVIRLEPGFENFLAPPSREEMLQAASDGPIIIINVSEYRCDAMMIDSLGFRAIELPQLSVQEIAKRERDLESPKTLAWLWDTIAGPVLESLGLRELLNGNTWPRIRWIPTGSLVRFPIHAAGYHLEGNSRTVLDRAISSYGWSLKSIINNHRTQRTGMDAQVLSRKVLLVSMRDTPQHSRLRHVDSEIDAVRTVCNAMKFAHVQPEPLRDEVLSALDDCDIFHFAGHADAKEADPMTGSLLLKDWQYTPLTVESLFNLNLSTKAPFLAYLSACGTSQNRNDSSMDENIHLAGAFQLAGFRHVIATLWEVDDALCVRMAQFTYEFLEDHGICDKNVSGALHYATRRLRDDWARKGGSRNHGGSDGSDGNVALGEAHEHCEDDDSDSAPVAQPSIELQAHNQGGNKRRRGKRNAKLKMKKSSARLFWVPYVHYGA